MKPTRRASTDESKEFFRRLQEVLEATKARLARLRDSNYELRTVTVKTHDVIAHTRRTYRRVYLAKKPTRKRSVTQGSTQASL